MDKSLGKKLSLERQKEFEHQLKIRLSNYQQNIHLLL